MVAAPPANLEIRPVTLDDLDRLIEIYLDTAIHHATIDPDVFQVPPRDAIEKRLRRRIEGRGATGEYVAALVDGEMVGSASVDLGDAMDPGNMMRSVANAEFGVSVVESWRGRGIGRALIEHVERWAADHGVERMILHVSAANTGAIGLYESMGYVDVDREMRKSLTG